MPWSNNGTVQVSSGGTIATGTGTTFLSSARVGDAITIAGSTSLHEVTAIASNTQLTFQPPYTGTTGSGKAYRIAPIMGYDKDLSDAFNSIRLQWGTQLSSLQPWATAATADIALSNLGGSQTGTAVFKGSPAAGRIALGLDNAATRAVQTSPTDTTAGALMAVGAFGLGLPISLVRTDINSVSTAGFFTCDECTGTPSGYISGMLLSHSDGPVVRMQIFNPRGTGKLFFRDYLYGWGAWRELYHQNNILGTVSQSGGIPAGAIIERGSNANGEYVRFADGTQICTRTLANAFSMVAYGSTGLFMGSFAITWPVDFITPPSVSGTGIDSSMVGIVSSIATSPGTCEIIYFSASATFQAALIRVIAVGRWY